MQAFLKGGAAGVSKEKVLLSDATSSKTPKGKDGKAKIVPWVEK